MVLCSIHCNYCKHCNYCYCCNQPTYYVKQSSSQKFNVTLDLPLLRVKLHLHIWLPTCSKPKIFQKSVSSRNLLFSLNTRYFPFCWPLILCYQLVKNRTGGTGTEKSCFRFVGCLDFRSCLSDFMVHVEVHFITLLIYPDPDNASYWEFKIKFVCVYWGRMCITKLDI